MFSLDADGEPVFHKLFPGYVMFPDFLETVKEEANYWKGYGTYLEKQIRANQQYDDLDEGMALVKKATNLRQSIYNDVKLIDKADAGSKRLDDLEKRIVLKAFEMAKMRNEFVDYLSSTRIPIRQKYSKKLKEEDDKTRKDE